MVEWPLIAAKGCFQFFRLRLPAVPCVIVVCEDYEISPSVIFFAHSYLGSLFHKWKQRMLFGVSWIKLQQERCLGYAWDTESKISTVNRQLLDLWYHAPEKKFWLRRRYHSEYILHLSRTINASKDAAGLCSMVMSPKLDSCNGKALFMHDLTCSNSVSIVESTSVNNKYSIG